MFRDNSAEIFQDLSVLILSTGPKYEKLPDTSAVDFRSGSCTGILNKRGSEREIFQQNDMFPKSAPYGFKMLKIPEWRYLWLIDSYYAQYTRDFCGKVTAIRYRIDEYKCHSRCKPWKKLEIIFDREEPIQYSEVWHQYLGQDLSNAQIKAVFKSAEKNGILTKTARF